MRCRQVAILLFVVCVIVLALGSGVAWAAEQRWSQDAVESGGSYMYTDPETGKTLLLPRKYLPEDFQPPPSTGMCDEAVEALVDNWRSNAKFLAIALAALAGAYGLFVLVEDSSS